MHSVAGYRDPHPGDSGFYREEIMAWCEANGVGYVLGLAKNSRLKARLADALAQAKTVFQRTGQAARVFREFTYQARDSWSRPRRVIGKAEHLSKGVSASLCGHDSDAPRGGRPIPLWVAVLCPRGDGKPDHETATGPVRRPYQFAQDASQSAAPVLRRFRLRAAVCPAPTGTTGDRHGPGSVRHHPSALTEDRRPNHARCSPALALVIRRLPRCRVVQAGTAQP